MREFEDDDRLIKHRMIATVSVIIIILISLVFCFIAAYVNLRNSVQEERTDYISEVSSQLAGKIQSSRHEYAARLTDTVSYLNTVSPSSYNQLSSLFPPSDSMLMLVDADGTVVKTDGQNVLLGTKDFIGKIISLHTTETSFCSINQNHDWWIFGSPIQPLSISGHSYVILLCAYPSEVISRNLEVSLFGGAGAAYVLSPGGIILMKPNSPALSFNGFNLFSSMAAQGASEKDIAELKKQIAGKSQDSFLLKISGKQWLISFIKLEDQDEVLAVTIPLSLTAARTYFGLLQTIIFAATVVLVLSLLLIVIFLYFSKIDKDRAKRVAAITAQSNFLSKMSHDIRTPLSTILGMLTLAKNNFGNQKQTEICIEKAENSANYLLELINDVLDMRRIESGKLEIVHEQFSPEKMLSDIETMVLSNCTAKKITFTIIKEHSLSEDYIGDEVRLKQILMNLLSNAIKFTGEGGIVTLSVCQNSAGSKKTNTIFKVTDTGIGMSPEFLKRIFKPFEQERSSYTTTYTGSGLGLNIVRSLTELMNGLVSVESALGTGSTFTVSIPFETTARTLNTDSKNPDKQRIISFHGERILLAEDNEMNRQIASELLTENLSLKVAAVGDGEQAVEIFSQTKEHTFDAILLDVRMPVMDGLMAAQAIRKMNRSDAKEIPIIALSANAFSEDIQLSLSAGMNGHLAKPFNLFAISTELHKYLD